jgi:nitroreductase
MDYDGLMELVTKRRSRWHLRSDPVPDASIEGIVDSARYAPSGFELRTSCSSGYSQRGAGLVVCSAWLGK